MNSSRAVNPSTPRIVGAEHEFYPYISGYGVLQRIVALGMPTSEQLMIMGVRRKTGRSMLRPLLLPGRVQDTFASAIEVRDVTTKNLWNPAAWLPVQSLRLLAGSELPYIRCPACALHGYHCSLFLLPSISACPWHGEKLISHCEACGRTLGTSFDHSGGLGTCTCGFQPIDAHTALLDVRQFPAREVSQWVDDYLHWASRQRAGRVIHFPSDAQSWPSALARLIDRTTPMPPVHQDDGNAHVRYEAFQPSADDPEPGAFWGWAMIGGNSGLMCAPLPLMAYDALTRATAAACARVGLEGLSVLSFRSTHYDTQGPTEVERHESFLAPYGVSASGATWLNLSVVDPMVTLACGTALELAAAAFGIANDKPDRSPSVIVASVLDSIKGRSALVDALVWVLATAYEEGLALTLARVFKLNPKDVLPSGGYPVIELQGSARSLREVRVAWVTPRKTARIQQKS